MPGVAKAAMRQSARTFSTVQKLIDGFSSYSSTEGINTARTNRLRRDGGGALQRAAAGADLQTEG
jgi:hypothetical protein